MGIRRKLEERHQYGDITWLMSSIDVVSVVERMGLSISGVRGDQVWTFCPDHHLFVGRSPSHAKWTVNLKTGSTFCFTEGRGSNLVWTISRLRECSNDEAVMWLTGASSSDEINSLKLLGISNAAKRMVEPPVREKKTIANLHDIEKGIKNGVMQETGYKFFLSPPGKKETGIERETLKHFNVFQRDWGYYVNRVIIPFTIKEEVVGFVAIDILGQKQWLNKNPIKKEGDYRKALYPSGFMSSNCLFNYDEIEKNADFIIITEGPREVLKLWQEGFKNSVAVLGSNIHDGQVELLSELAPKKVIIMLDGDDKGVEASAKIGKKLMRIFSTEIAYPPRGSDPKNLSCSELKKLIKYAKPI